LRGFTLDAARAGFAETEVGSLTPGKRADFVVLSHDLEDLAPASILELRVESTWVDGQRVFPSR
jgi:predicted amidohydrolase YtcJ